MNPEIVPHRRVARGRAPGPLIACAALLGVTAPAAADDARCQQVRFADVGWTDITATTAVVTELLHDRGYRTKIDLLSVPVTFRSLKNHDIDVFLGNWMPTMTADIQPYLADGSVVDVGVNLEGALYTLAVPRYVYQAGVRSAADLAANGAKFQRRIYGIEPGNDGNRTVLDMISKNTYGLAGWKLVESSEQGMLAEVSRAVASKQWIVFLGWKPHPMNNAIAMEYLADPGEAWGPGGGASVVHTVVDRAFAEQCRDLLGLLRAIKFDIATENRLMGRILDDKLEPAPAAREWITAHPEIVAGWTTAFDRARAAAGKAVASVAVEASTRQTGGTHKIPLGARVEAIVLAITTGLSGELRAVSRALGWLIEGTIELLEGAPPLVLALLLAVLSYAMQRRVWLSLGVVAGCLVIWNLGYWEATIETLALVITSTVLCVLLGVPIGVVASRRPRLWAVIRVVLDLMQTIPTFVYLIPALMLFGLGIVPGILATVVFALPAMIRLTHLGLVGVPREVIEAGEAFGARPAQRLFKIEVPYALPTIIEGVTQTLMLSLSMIVIAALVGAGGLGAPVVRALNTVNIAQGFEAGLCIVILAIMLDRAFRYRTQHERS